MSSSSAARLRRPALSLSDRKRLGPHARRYSFQFITVLPAHLIASNRNSLGDSPRTTKSDRLQPNNSFKAMPLRGTP